MEAGDIKYRAKKTLVTAVLIIAAAGLTACGSTPTISAEAMQKCETFMQSSHPNDKSPKEVCTAAAQENPESFMQTFGP
jgi:hypothetical protein